MSGGVHRVGRIPARSPFLPGWVLGEEAAAAVVVMVEVSWAAIIKEDHVG